MPLISAQWAGLRLRCVVWTLTALGAMQLCGRGSVGAVALADARRLTAQHPRRSAADWFNLAFLLDKAGYLSEAGAAFRQALALQPALDRAWYGLGLTLTRRGCAEAAVEAFLRSTELQPMSPHAWYQLARLHAERSNAGAALAIIRHLRGFEPVVADRLESETGLTT